MNSKNKEIKIRLAVIIPLLICLLPLSSCGRSAEDKNISEDKDSIAEYIRQLPDEGCCG